MDVRLLALLFILVSCMPQSEVGRGNLASTGTTTGGTTGEETPTEVPQSATSWNYLAVNATNITINVSNLNNAYLVGTSVEKYLGALNNNVLTNFTGVDYCVVNDFSLGGIKHQLRSRAVPIAYYDFTARRTVRAIRVDFNDVTNSTSTCGVTLKVQDQNGNYVIDTTAPATPVYDPSNVCPTCTSKLTTTKVRLFKKVSNELQEVPTPSINLASLTLQVDPNYSAAGTVGTCSNTDCKARGFDCCLENQCVKDGSPRPSATTVYFSQWQAAEQEKLLNPLAYINYPQIYYVCGTTVPVNTEGGNTTGGSSTGGTPPVDYTDGFNLLKKDYKCVEHIKAQSTLSPFHNEILTRVTPYNPAVDCLTLSTDAGKTMYYQEVMKRLYKTCGCSKTTLLDMISSCPAYEYTVVLKDSAGEPSRIDCYTPPSVVHVPNIQNVSMSSRSAPHRFFESVTGLEKNILGNEKTYIQSGVTKEYVQEGDKFEYLDDGKIIPSQKDFSMNAILGQMSVNLTLAQPAKAVDVELDQVYVISTISGYYSPCPTCMRDSWISTFTAYPGSAMGVGLQAVGHSTQRDVLGTNFTSGNYEDTIFGRACWVPPTMIPFSHAKKGTAQEQRMNRLKTQAALWVNGYQRDWYGFNKGALIGSFDGVSWFAIGKGRIVKSSTKKLFLAINAPFADLATNSLHVVQIQSYDGVTGAAQVDYDPKFHLSHPLQNEAGNCQANHICETDADCVTRLGWEYACNDVRELKTLWPVFDADAKEKPNTDTGAITIDQILQQKKLGSDSTKRCVYRGAGALCIRNPRTIPGTDMAKRRNLTCASNFYCAGVTSSSFNSKIARWAAPLQDLPIARNHLYGRDANVLGRPLNYPVVNGPAGLPNDVRSTLEENMLKYDSNLTTANLGLCMPGKSLAGVGIFFDPVVQHQSADSQKRTDYISQVGSCDSTHFDISRYTSCPTFNADGNFEIFDDTWSSGYASQYSLRSRAQNACGLDALHTSVTSGDLTSKTADELQVFSPFRLIEGKPLSSSITVGEPTLVRDACKRRAGAVCHTDLDCSPNKMMADQVDYFDIAYFGNVAEQSYYKEYLVCGQAEPKPMPSNSTAFKDYNMGKNRCCREVGKDLTTYTRDLPTSNAPGAYVEDTLNLEILDPVGTKPNRAKRYSRFASVEGLDVTGSKPILNANHERDGTGLLNGGYQVATPYQWNTLSETNSETCCGGGWIRKFSDGTTDWTRRNRLYIDVNNFKCINSKTVLLTDPAVVVGEYGNDLAGLMNLINRDFIHYCRDSKGATGNCAQYGFTSKIFEEAPVLDNYAFGNEIRIDTIAPGFSNTYWPKNNDLYFLPMSADTDSATIIDYANTNATARRNIQLQIPSYINKSHFDEVYSANDSNGDDPLNINMIASDGVNLDCEVYNSNLPNVTDPTQADQDPTNICPAAYGCCYHFNTSTRVLRVVAASTEHAASGDNFFNKRVGVTFTVRGAGSASGIQRMRPGNDLYYLSRLGKLELSGIPQIYFEPLYCSDNYNRIVPGIFKPEFSTYSSLTPSNSFSTVPGAGAPKYTSHHALASEPIFSANDFKCCAPLGKTVDKADKCCSGHGRPFGDGTAFTCMLPRGTDLMVYFNRFVSNEGVDEDGPGGGLKPEDFNDQTGEPGWVFNSGTGRYELSSAAIDKLRALGGAFCDTNGQTKVRQGGAFGSYEPEPAGPLSDLSNKFYTLVDSSRDNAQISNAGATIDVGYSSFMNGYRWNHHLYCND